MSLPAGKTFVTAEKAAKLAGCTSAWIRRLLKRGDLPGTQICGWTWVIDVEDVRALSKTLTSRSVSNREAPPKPTPRRRTKNTPAR